MKPLVSVIIVTYNQESTIARAIDSVLGQACNFKFEIILGEDCSMDKTREICIDYAKRFPDIIKLHLNSHNKGVLNNYFDCFAACSGKYIADCAGDDFWIDSNKLQQQVDILEKDNSLSAVHTNWYFYHSESHKKELSDTRGDFSVFRKPRISGKELLLPILTQKKIPVIHTCTTLFRADILRKAYEKDPYLFRNSDFICEDLQLTFILALNGNIAFIDTPTLCYTVEDNSISNTTDDLKQFKFSLGVLKLCQYISSHYNITDPEVDKFLDEVLFKMLMHLFRSKSFDLTNLVDNEAKLLGGYNIKCKILSIILKHKILYYPTKLFRDSIVYIKNKLH